MISDIVIVSLGKGNPDFLNSRTIHLLYESKHLILRTGRHPIVPWLISHQISFSTLDFLYDEADDFEEESANEA